MNFDQAVVAHTSWKNRIKSFINQGEKLDPETVSQDHRCELGQWLHGEGVALTKYAEYQELKRRHAEFHQVAAEVIRRAAVLPSAQALELLSFGSPYAQASAACVNAIISLKDKCQSK